MAIYPLTPQLEDYLCSTPTVDFHHPAVMAQAQTLTAEPPDAIAKVRCLFEWVRDRIPHTSDINGDIVTCAASEVLAAGTGICFAKSHLLAALLRAVGIPAGFCYQVCAQDNPENGMILHGLNGVYLASCDRWIRLDPRGNTGGIDAQFDLEQERLAFPPDKTLGEFLYPQIWPHPLPVITQLLSLHHSRQTLWPHIPASID